MQRYEKKDTNYTNYTKNCLSLRHDTKNNFDNRMLAAVFDGEYGWRLAIC